MPVVIAGLILSFLVMMVFGGTELDRTLLYLVALRDAPGLKHAASWLSEVAAPQPLLLLALAGSMTLIIRVRWLDALFLLLLVLSGQLLVEALQALTSDLRPAADDQLLTVRQSLYPSAHAASATVAALGVAFVATRRFPARAWALVAAALLALGVGAARLVIGGAWPSDVIGGWALGLAWTLLLLLLARVDLGDGTGRPLRHSRKGETYEREPPHRDRPPH